MNTSKKIVSGTSAALLVASTLAGPLFAAKTASAVSFEPKHQLELNKVVLSSSDASLQEKFAQAKKAYEAASEELARSQSERDSAYVARKVKAEEEKVALVNAKNVKQEAILEITSSSAKSPQELQDAQNSYDKASADLEAAQKNLDAMNAKVTEAESALKAAENELKEAETAFAEEKKELDDAEAAKQTASDELEKAEADVVQAEKNLEKSETDLENKQKEKESTEKAISEANSKVEANNVAAKQAKAKVDEAKEALDKAVEERDAVQVDYDQKSASLKNAQNALTKAQQENTKDASAIAEGSQGFFESNGSSYAANIVKNPEATSGLSDSHTDVGNSNDATSLENMKKAIERMSKINELRVSVGLPELKVYDSLVAISQVQTNYGSVEMNHAGNCGSTFPVGENLSWGYSDPFKGWYTQEKDVFDAFYKAKTGNSTTISGAAAYNWAQKNYTGSYSDIGHYMNIINPNYVYTGFAYNTKNTKYRVCDGQTFTLSYDTILKKSGDSVYTFSDYQKRFMTYYNKVNGVIDPSLSEDVTQAQTEADNSQKILVEKKQVYETKNVEYNKANATYQSASEVLATAESEVDSLEKTLAEQNAEIATLRANKTSAETQLLAYQQIRNQKATAYEIANQKVESLKESTEELVAARDVFDAAKTELDEANAEKENAQEVLDATNKNVVTAFSAYEEAEVVANELKAYLAEEEAEKLFFGDVPSTWSNNPRLLKMANYVSTKKGEYKDAISLANEKRAELEEANAVYLASEEALKLATDNFETASQNYQEAKEAFDASTKDASVVTADNSVTDEDVSPQLVATANTQSSKEAYQGQALPQTSDAGDIYWVGGTCLVAAGVSVAAKRKLNYN